MPFDAPDTGSIPFLGRKNADIMVVLDPLVSQYPSKTPLRKDDLDWLGQRIKKYANLKESQVCFASCARPISYEDYISDKKVTDALKAQEDEFIQLVNEVSPKLIVPMGAKACQQVFGRKQQITKIRGQVFEASKSFGTTPILPLTSPFYARKHPEADNLFCADIETLGRLVKGKFQAEAAITKIATKYEWCMDIQHLLDNPPELISLDCETKGLYPFDPETRLLTVQITTAPGNGIIIPIEYDAADLRVHRVIKFPGSYSAYITKIVGQLKRLLENKRTKVIGQNLKFDWLMLYYKLKIEIANYSDDTILMAHLLDENMMSKNLDDLVRIFVPAMSGYADTFNKDPIHHGKTRMDLVPPDKMIAYGCGDTDAAFRLYNKLLPKLRRDRKLYQCYRKTVMRAIRAFCYMEQTGFYINKQALKDFEIDLKRQQDSEAKWLLAQIPEVIKAKFRDTGVGLKPDRDVLLVDYLYEHPAGLRLQPMAYTKTGKPSTSSKIAMPYYVADYPFIARLTDYIKNQKMLTTYLAGFYKYIFDGRIRPSYALHKTTTGRSASSDPNGQNFPKRGKMAKRFRKAFAAPKGWVYIQVDLSQAELRIASMISGDERMQEVYKSGGDIHRSTAAGVMGISLEEFFKLDPGMQSLKRFQAKAVNFGFIYGMWWKKFRQYAKTDYGIDFTEEEAESIRSLFFRTYPRLEEWHRAIEQFVKKHKFVRAFNGRIRHLPMVDSPDESIAKQAVRQAINSPVQSIASDLGLMAIGLLVPYLRRTGLWENIKVCGFIHDSIVCLVKEEYAAKAIRIVKRYMENLPLKRWFGWEPEVPIVADAEIGYNLAETYEVSPKYFSKESGNKSFKDIERAVLTDDLEKARKKGDKDALASLEEKLGMKSSIPLKVRRPYTRITPKATEQKHAKVKTVRRPKKAA
jgi:DNA polymerase I-like protein with 3'-5' exonuclease and polymerase domains